MPRTTDGAGFFVLEQQHQRSGIGLLMPDQREESAGSQGADCLQFTCIWYRNSGILQNFYVKEYIATLNVRSIYARQS